MDVDARAEARKQKGAGVFYGWRNMIILGLIFFVTMALVFNTATIANTYMKLDESMRMNATILGMGFSVYILLQGWAAPLIGRVGQRLGGFKQLFIVGTALCAVCSFVCSMWMNDAITYLVVFGVFMSIGTGCAGQVPTDATVAYWFKRKRGLVLGVILGFSGLAAIIGPPIVHGVISAVGDWRAGWWFLTGCSVVACILACFLYAKPEDYGQVAYGSEDVVGVDDPSAKVKKPIGVFQRQESLTFREGMRSLNTWLIMLGGGVGQFTYTFTVSFGMLHFMDLGFAAVMVTAALSARGVGSSLGGFIPGFLADRIEPIRMQGANMVVTGILFLLGATTGSQIVLFLFFFFTGWAIGSQKSLCPTALANWLGTDNFPRVYGYTLLVLATLASLIPVATGALYDATGTYALATQIVGASAIVGGVACFLVRYPKKARATAASAESEQFENSR